MANAKEQRVETLTGTVTRVLPRPAVVFFDLDLGGVTIDAEVFKRSGESIFATANGLAKGDRIQITGKAQSREKIGKQDPIFVAYAIEYVGAETRSRTGLVPPVPPVIPETTSKSTTPVKPVTATETDETIGELYRIRADYYYNYRQFADDEMYRKELDNRFANALDTLRKYLGETQEGR